jgi:DNA-binding NarL/FixJ family response regulator
MSTTVLVAEDEFLIAMDVMDELDMAGFQTIGPFAEISGALDCCRRKLPDCAVLDVRLRDGESYPLADWLAAQQVPVVFHSAHASARELAARYPHARICPKPASTSSLAEAVAQLCDARVTQAST